MSDHFLKIIFPYCVITILAFIVFDITLAIIFYAILGYLFIGILGNMIGYHRYLSHKSFSLNPTWHKIITFLGALSGQGSPLFWVALHRHHHKYSDTDKDIHSPKLGLYESTLKWQIYKTNKFDALVWPRDLIKDKWLKFLHANYYSIYWSTFALVSLISFEFAFGFIILGGTILMFLLDTIGNYIMHSKKIGKTSFVTNDNSKNIPWFNIIVFGSGYHNNHHANPSAYKFHKYDLSAKIIEFIKNV